MNFIIWLKFYLRCDKKIFEIVSNWRSSYNFGELSQFTILRIYFSWYTSSICFCRFRYWIACNIFLLNLNSKFRFKNKRQINFKTIYSKFSIFKFILKIIMIWKFEKLAFVGSYFRKKQKFQHFWLIHSKNNKGKEPNSIWIRLCFGPNGFR